MTPSPQENVLIEFLKDKMSMTDVYQPAVIKDLLQHDGRRSRTDLARMLAQYDVSVRDYYVKVVMRWPKQTLEKHGIVEYDRRSREFSLCHLPEDRQIRENAVQLCDQKIADWLERKALQENAPEAGASIRYEVLKAARGKCQLCGIPSSLRPTDIDHVIPRSNADKRNKVRFNGRWIDVNDRENLQALCMSCNRAKRAADQTDFRPAAKLVRDRIPEIISSEGREPCFRRVSGAQMTHALFEKLIEEHAELIADKDHASRKLEELADMIEVIFAIARQDDVSEDELMEIVRRKRADKGAFREGYLLSTVDSRHVKSS
jgi:predicted house-cleaning noncanonical NTP pyrophosphatase (MazG superfamily)